MDSSKFMTHQENALIYLRVSTEEQTENYSLQNQEAICLLEAQRRGLNVVRIFREEGKSAKTITGRPALLELLEVCRKHRQQISAVIIHHIDRLSRQAYDYLGMKSTLARYKIEIISVGEPSRNDPMGHFVDTLFAGIAQFDNELRSERAKNGMEARFRAGLPNSAVPLGYFNRNSLVIIDPKTFYLLRTAWEEMARGVKSVRQLVRDLTARGLRSKNGKPLRHQHLLNIFRNKFYAGAIVSKKHGQEMHGKHPAMISEELYYRVQAVLDGRSKKKLGGVPRLTVHPDFPLRQLIKCVHCGKGFTGSWSQGRIGRYAYYFCMGRCSEVRSIPVKTIHDAITVLLEKFELRSTAMKRFCRFLRVTYVERSLTVRQRQARLSRKAELAAQQRQTLLKKHFAGLCSQEVYQEQSKLIDEEMKAVVIAKDIAMTTRYNLEEIARFVQDKLANIPTTYAAATVEQRRSLIRGLFPARLAWSRRSFVNLKISPYYLIIADSNNSSELKEHLKGAAFEQMLHWLDQLRKEYQDIGQ